MKPRNYHEFEGIFSNDSEDASLPDETALVTIDLFSVSAYNELEGNTVVDIDTGTRYSIKYPYRSFKKLMDKSQELQNKLTLIAN